MRLTVPVLAVRHRLLSFHHRTVRSALVCSAVAGSALAGCSGDGGGPIEDNLIRPGITAMNDATVLACSSDKAALQAALDTYEIMQGDPAGDQAALVEAGYLRQASELHDVTDGQIRPIDPGCT